MRHTHVYVYKVVHINILLGIERLKSKRNTYWYPFFCVLLLCLRGRSIYHLNGYILYYYFLYFVSFSHTQSRNNLLYHHYCIRPLREYIFSKTFSRQILDWLHIIYLIYIMYIYINRLWVSGIYTHIILCHIILYVGWSMYKYIYIIL